MARKKKSRRKSSRRRGPGEYLPDPTEGITRPEDLPKPKIVEESRDYKKRPCPSCGYKAYRDGRSERKLHDLGDVVTGRPRGIRLTFSQHHCTRCDRYFYADTSDIAPPNAQYTTRVIALAVRLVVEYDEGDEGPRAEGEGAEGEDQGALRQQTPLRQAEAHRLREGDARKDHPRQDGAQEAQGDHGRGVWALRQALPGGDGARRARKAQRVRLLTLRARISTAIPGLEGRGATSAPMNTSKAFRARYSAIGDAHRYRL